MASRFYRCNVCGNLIGLIHDGKGELVCCGQGMQELTANTTDAAQEKHVPVVAYDQAAGVLKVTVGSVEHPMTQEHFIEWIHVQTKQGGLMRHLTPEDKPMAVFRLAEGDEPVAVFEYCNLHGLWKKDMC
ncbi:MAG: desulfoferrodoxin FeS4 iron-binding domain-containing protein [Selenomonas sp.]|uniref:desulfoferrodoxin family protein n=1 Tax=Selenomonas sp. AE3005 TaxID=1485543 RepID=UPI000489A888|nr:desulfoferrodoxin family protein [Selenomonas sp. AE3005]MBQ1919566.1 desulfoferrodoxin FeS4 iron-binding domain-containing protein [Selenomonas sp.]MBQ2087234.1 desulfoferrodoxin FeS4 iron-binding domain-containing protein [Selenomonas sp.]